MGAALPALPPAHTAGQHHLVAGAGVSLQSAGGKPTILHPPVPPPHPAGRSRLGRGPVTNADSLALLIEIVLQAAAAANKPATSVCSSVRLRF